MTKLLPPQAYINFETVDAAIGFFGEVPKGYEGVYTESYVIEVLSTHNEDIDLIFKEYKRVEDQLVKCMEALYTSDPIAYMQIFRGD